MNDKKVPAEGSGFRVEDRRFWARKATGQKKEGEKPPRKSDYPTVVEQLHAQMEAAQQKLKERLEKLDSENSAFRKRVNSEMERRLQRERMKIVEVLLEVLDNLDTALKSGAGSKKSLTEGVRVIRDDLWSRIKYFKVDRIEALGCRFDPEIHEAVMTRDVDPEMDGSVIEEIQPGYRTADFVVRHARVVVGRVRDSDNQ